MPTIGTLTGLLRYIAPDIHLADIRVLHEDLIINFLGLLQLYLEGRGSVHAGRGMGTTHVDTDEIVLMNQIGALTEVLLLILHREGSPLVGRCKPHTELNLCNWQMKQTWTIFIILA